MANNSLTDLNAILFEELGRLNEIDIEKDDKEKVAAELSRSKQLASIAKEISATHSTAIEVARIRMRDDGFNEEAMAALPKA